VAKKAVDLGLARVRRSEEEFREVATTIIINTRRGIERMMKSGLIPPFPKSPRSSHQKDSASSRSSSRDGGG
jgi:ribosomal protein L19E